MGFFDLIGSTKDRIDKSRQAREYIQRAKELINDGNDIYNKAYNKVRAYASETEYLLVKHNDYKKNISNELGNSIGVTLNNFAKFKIESKVITVPTLPAIHNSNSSINGFNSMVRSCIGNTVLISLSDFFISDSDYYEAKYKRDEARRYKEHMKLEREKLYAYKEKMSEIRSFITYEKNELDSLMAKIRKMNDDLKAGMNKKSFSNEDAEYLKSIYKISKCIISLLSTEFLGDSFSINEKYHKIFNEIKNINQNLPVSPSIGDPNTIITIKRILDKVVVY